MNRSVDRIVTSHAGSLPRPPELVRLMWDQMDGKAVNTSMLETWVSESVAEMVRRQRAIGIDLVSDGEMSKIGFSNYIFERYSGFSGQAQIAAMDLADFPDLAMRLFGNEAGAHVEMRYCTGPVELIDGDAVQRDIARLKTALDGDDPATAFMCAPSPGQIVFNHPNQHYPTHEAYLEAVVEAMRYEYNAIIDAGLILQVDSPDLAAAAHLSSVGTDIKESASTSTRGSRH